MSLLTVPIGRNAPVTVQGIVEIPKGSSNKYEFDLQNEVFVLDRVLYSPLYYPCDYGWVAGTLSEDGDPLDILILGSHPTFPGCVVEARPLGALSMSDEHGRDYKILAVSARDPRHQDARVLSDVSPHLLREIEHFFRIYKDLEEKETEVLGWISLEETYRIILQSHQRLTGKLLQAPGPETGG
ncbi:MAG TPA: inorganic diphosphatase [Armatimonadota bacterium]|nr:inorganic diphosphatase [Armatimonadota bacterium]